MRDLSDAYIDELLSLLSCAAEEIVFEHRDWLEVGSGGPEGEVEMMIQIALTARWRASSPDLVNYVFIDDRTKEELDRRARSVRPG